MQYEMQHLKTADLVGQRNTLSIHKIFVHLTRSIATAVFISECLYWQQRAIAEGKSEFYMSLEPTGNGPSWEDYGLTRANVDGARSLLEPLGILTSWWEMMNGKRTTFYRLDLQKLDEAIGRFKATGERLTRKLSINEWHTWRKESQGQHPTRSDRRVTVPMIRAAVVTRKPSGSSAPTLPPKPAPTAARSGRSVMQFKFPIAYSVWGEMTDIQRRMSKEQARRQWPDAQWLEAMIMGYEAIVGSCSRRDLNSRNQFAPKAIKQAINYLGQHGKPCDRLAAINFLASGCTLLQKTDEASISEGGKRLDGILISMTPQEATKAPTPQPDRPVVDLDKLTDAEIVRLPEDVLRFDDHDRWCANERLRMVKAGEMRPRKPGETRDIMEWDVYRIAKPEPPKPEPAVPSMSAEEFFASVGGVR